MKAAAIALCTFAFSAHAEEPEEKIKQVESYLKELANSESVIPPSPKEHPVKAMYNNEAVIPPQCYTNNEEKYNSCYVCHQKSIPGRENVMNDEDLQAEYSFSDVGMTNHWKNLFEDKTERVAKISDESILEYINQDNYSELPERLKNAGYKGWIPDLKNLHLAHEAFDQHGFAKDGSHWVAFNYTPFPSTFWPTNGSTDDVMIRLVEDFRSKKNRSYSLDVYRANLAILEANIKGLKEINCLPVDESAVEKDLNKDGKLTQVDRITATEAWVGSASNQKMYQHIYPAGTEFLHTVRYVGIGKSDEIHVPKRMKEVRYMKKWKSYGQPYYARKYEEEGFDKDAGNLPGYQNINEHGLDNGTGWAISGFIEDRKGKLRKYTYEENFSCMGCHNSVGATIDKTFSFARKPDGASGWGYIDLKILKDTPNQGGSLAEIETYLKRVGGGSEFRNNEEMQKRFFNEDGSFSSEKFAKAKNVYEMITPSKERALTLNKAYKIIVDDQDYIYGKDATVTPPTNVFQRIDNEKAKTLPKEKQYDWNIILDWSKDKKTAHK